MLISHIGFTIILFLASLHKLLLLEHQSCCFVLLFLSCHTSGSLRINCTDSYVNDGVDRSRRCLLCTASVKAAFVDPICTDINNFHLMETLRQ